MRKYNRWKRSRYIIRKMVLKIKKKNLYNEGIMSKMNNSLYIYKDKTKVAVLNKREKILLISPIGRDYLRK